MRLRMPDMSEEEPPAATTGLCSIKAAPKAKAPSLKAAIYSKAPAASMKSSKAPATMSSSSPVRKRPERQGRPRRRWWI